MGLLLHLSIHLFLDQEGLLWKSRKCSHTLVLARALSLSLCLWETEQAEVLGQQETFVGRYLAKDMLIGKVGKDSLAPKAPGWQ